jgi:hypothetical protein
LKEIERERIKNDLKGFPRQGGMLEDKEKLISQNDRILCVKLS